jgi:hypothetical protein
MSEKGDLESRNPSFKEKSQENNIRNEIARFSRLIKYLGAKNY